VTGDAVLVHPMDLPRSTHRQVHGREAGLESYLDGRLAPPSSQPATVPSRRDEGPELGRVVRRPGPGFASEVPVRRSHKRGAMFEACPVSNPQTAPFGWVVIALTRLHRSCSSG
jgi:hypothetical protein